MFYSQFSKLRFGKSSRRFYSFLFSSNFKHDRNSKNILNNIHHPPSHSISNFPFTFLYLNKFCSNSNHSENYGHFSFLKKETISLSLLFSSLLFLSQFRICNDNVVTECEMKTILPLNNDCIHEKEDEKNGENTDCEEKQKKMDKEKENEKHAGEKEGESGESKGREEREEGEKEAKETKEIKEEEVEVELRIDKLACHIPKNKTKKWSKQVVLLEIGSFNPITFMHLRMLEMAKDHLFDFDFDVLGAYISPVNDSYKKNTLISSKDRMAMCELAIQSSPFIMMDTWEANQKSYKRTLQVLKKIQKKLNEWNGDKIQIILVCGSDLLESFLIPGVWIEKEVHEILNSFGIVCISREGKNIRKTIHENDILYEHRKNIWVIDEVIENNISSSKLRKNISRGLSIKYLTHDDVIDYIKDKNLYA